MNTIDQDMQANNTGQLARNPAMVALSHSGRSCAVAWLVVAQGAQLLPVAQHCTQGFVDGPVGEERV